MTLKSLQIITISLKIFTAVINYFFYLIIGESFFIATFEHFPKEHIFSRRIH